MTSRVFDATSRDADGLTPLMVASMRPTEVGEIDSRGNGEVGAISEAACGNIISDLTHQGANLTYQTDTFGKVACL